MRLLGKIAAVIAVFAIAGYGAMRVIINHAVARGTPEYAVRLAGAMTGLFCGGVASVLLALFLFLKTSPGSQGHR